MFIPLWIFNAVSDFIPCVCVWTSIYEQVWGGTLNVALTRVFEDSLNWLCLGLVILLLKTKQKTFHNYRKAAVRFRLNQILFTFVIPTMSALIKCVYSVFIDTCFCRIYTLSTFIVLYIFLFAVNTTAV